MASIQTTVLMGVLLAASTEVLSLYRAITKDAIAGFWICCLLLCAALVGFTRNTPRYLPHRALTWGEGLQVGLIALMGFATLICALLYPPHTHDAMTYHMARVAHWIAHQDVAFYPTHVLRQLYQMPLPGFALLHLQLLSGGDRLANLVQWFSWCMVLVLIWEISGQLQAPRKGKFFAVMLWTTLPMGLLQASSTQTDLVVTVFILCMVHFLLRFRETPTWSDACWLGASMGLALYSKGTALLFIPPLGIALSLPLLWNTRLHKPIFMLRVAQLTASVVIAIGLTSAPFLRNQDAFGTPFSSETAKYKMESHRPSDLAANIVRHTVMHFGLPTHYLNREQTRFWKHLLGRSADDPKTTWDTWTFHIKYRNHEDYTGNIGHMLLTCFAVPFLFRIDRTKRPSSFRPLLFGWLGAWVFYCIILKWQPWATRLQTPLFALSFPLLPFLFTAENRIVRARDAVLIIAMLFLYSLRFAFTVSTRPLVGVPLPPQREESYFINVEKGLEKMSDLMPIRGWLETKDVHILGFIPEKSQIEYPIWLVLNRGASLPFRIQLEHVSVSNPSKKFEHPPLRYVLADRLQWAALKPSLPHTCIMEGHHFILVDLYVTPSP